MTTESIKAFTKRGGKIHKLPSFERKPLPPHRAPAPVQEQRAAPKAKASRPVITSLTLGQIAHRNGIKIGVLNNMHKDGLLPAPDDFGFNGTKRWTLPLVEKIAQLVTEREDEACKRETREIIERLRRKEAASGKAS